MQSNPTNQIRHLKICKITIPFRHRPIVPATDHHQIIIPVRPSNRLQHVPNRHLRLRSHHHPATCRIPPVLRIIWIWRIRCINPFILLLRKQNPAQIEPRIRILSQLLSQPRFIPQPLRALQRLQQPPRICLSRFYPILQKRPPRQLIYQIGILRYAQTTSVGSVVLIVIDLLSMALNAKTIIFD